MIEIIPKGYLTSSLNLCSPDRGLREAVGGRKGAPPVAGGATAAAGQALAFAQAKRRAKA